MLIDKIVNDMQIEKKEYEYQQLKKAGSSARTSRQNAGYRFITAYNAQHCRSHRDDYFQNHIPNGFLDCHNFTHLLSTLFLND